MLYNIFTLTALLISFSSCAHGSPKSTIVNQIINRHEKIQKEKKMFLRGSGSAIPDNVKGFILDYTSCQNLNVNEVRILMVNSIECLLEMANNNLTLRPYMDNYPFTTNNLPKYSMNFKSSNDKYVEQNYVAYATLINNRIYYMSYDPNLRDLIDVHEEPYEEALKIVRESGKLSKDCG